jgi:DNA-binding CsgD family transcriptional regulator
MHSDRVISLFYESAINPTLWPKALTAFADATGSVESNLTIFDSARDPQIFFSSSRLFGPEFLGLYASHYYKVEPLRARVHGYAGGTLRLCHEDVSDDEVAVNEFYQDFYLPGGGRYQAGFLLPDDRGALALHRRDARFDREETESRYGAMARHGLQAAQLALSLGQQGAREGMLRQVADREKIACLMIDAESRVIDCSRAAAVLLERGSPCRLSGHRLAMCTYSDTKRLRELTARCISGTGGGVMRLGHEQGSWLVEVLPAGVAAENPFDPRRAGCALVILRQSSASRPADVARIRMILECTPAEAEIGAGLLSGRTPGQIARLRNVSLNTVRTQIRGLLDKAGVTRLPQLLILLARLGCA